MRAGTFVALLVVAFAQILGCQPSPAAQQAPVSCAATPDDSPCSSCVRAHDALRGPALRRAVQQGGQVRLLPIVALGALATAGCAAPCTVAPPSEWQKMAAAVSAAIASQFSLTPVAPQPADAMCVATPGENDQALPGHADAGPYVCVPDADDGACVACLRVACCGIVGEACAALDPAMCAAVSGVSVCINGALSGTCDAACSGDQ
jgi:hypothetical protein